MKLVMAILIAVVSLAFPAYGDTQKNESKNKPEISVDLHNIARDQPRIKYIYEWDQQIIVEADSKFYRVDIDKLKTTPIFCPGGRELIRLSGQSGNKSYALCKDKGGLFMFSRSDKKEWDDLELPTSLRKTDGNVHMLSNSDKLMLLTDKYIYKYTDNKWEQVQFKQSKESKPNPLFSIGQDDHTILFKEKIFIAHNWGEWGGGLVSLEPTTGEWEEHFSGTPVTGLAINHKGELWVSQGLSHLGGVLGMIRRYDGKIWEVFSENKGFLDMKSRDLSYKKHIANNWPFSPADFNNLTFDKNDILIVLSGSFGILKYQEGNWSVLVKIDPHIYASSFYIVEANTILVGLYDGGIVVLDVVSGKYKRISIAESFYYWD